MLNDKERQQMALEVYQNALLMIAENYGVSVEVALQSEAISETYGTNRAVVILKPIPTWSPRLDSPDAVSA